MSLRRRSGLVELARKYDALVISDDVYDFLQWRLDQEDDTDLDELVLPRLCDIDLAMGPSSNDPDGFGHAISNGSFSKIAGPGCRTGWVEASPAFVHGLGLTGSSRSGGAPSQFCAAMLSQIVQTGELEAHINTKTRPTLKHRHRLIMGAVREHITSVEGIQVREASLLGGRTYGGYFVWIKLPEGFSASTVAQVARAEEKLIVAPGGMFEIAGDEDSARFDDHVRLCFAWEPEEALVEGTARLGRVLRRIKEKTTYYHQAFPTISGLEFLQAHK
jgi:DNA-binding transcriptional MocR family regulator